MTLPITFLVWSEKKKADYQGCKDKKKKKDRMLILSYNIISWQFTFDSKTLITAWTTNMAVKDYTFQDVCHVHTYHHPDYAHLDSIKAATILTTIFSIFLPPICLSSDAAFKLVPLVFLPCSCLT